MGSIATSGYKYCSCPTCFCEVVGTPTSVDFCAYCEEGCDGVGECEAGWDDLPPCKSEWDKEDPEG